MEVVSFGETKSNFRSTRAFLKQSKSTPLIEMTSKIKYTRYIIYVILVILIGCGFPMTFSKKRWLRVCSLWLVTKGEFL